MAQFQTIKDFLAEHGLNIREMLREGDVKKCAENCGYSRESIYGILNAKNSYDSERSMKVILELLSIVETRAEEAKKIRKELHRHKKKWAA